MKKETKSILWVVLCLALALSLLLITILYAVNGLIPINWVTLTINIIAVLVITTCLILQINKNNKTVSKEKTNKTN